MKSDVIIDGEPVNNVSPVYGGKISRQLTFPDAMREILLNKKITRSSWTNGDFCLLKDGFLEIYTKGGYHQWLISDGDLEGNDWVIKEEN